MASNTKTIMERTVKDGTGVMDVLNKKVEQMNAEIKRMREVLQAKEAVLDDVLCSINQLPRHPINTVLIQNILKSEVKQSKTSNLNDFKCCIAWSSLFLENICIAIEVENNTRYTISPSCFAICNCDLSDTTTVIFDNLLTTQHIPPKSKRTLLVSFRKGLLLSRQIILVLDCEFVTVSDSCSNLDISSFLPSNIRNRQTRTVEILDFDEPLKMFALSEMDDISLKEGLKLYQCLYACHFSKVLNFTPSYLRTVLRNIGKFKEIDFGDWQLFIGETDTIWNNFIIYANSLFMEGRSSQCRLFSKNECDMHRLTEMLDKSDTSYAIT